MKFSVSLAALSTAMGFASALQLVPQAFPLFPANTTYYYFKTQVRAAQPAAYNNLYVYAYHTGAGLSDVGLVRDVPYEAHRGWFNGTYLNWFQSSSLSGQLRYGFDYRVLSTNYASWSPATINGGQGTPGLGLDASNKLVVLGSEPWDSWLGTLPHHFYKRCY